MYDYIRIAVAVPEIALGNPVKNADAIIALMEKAEEKEADVVLFPELCLTGCTCDDLFFRDDLHQNVREALARIAFFSGSHPGLTAVVGLPVRVKGKLYNCAAVISHGEVSGLVPKTRLSARERRWFSPGISCYLEPENLGLVHSQDYYTVPMDPERMFLMAEDALAAVTFDSPVSSTPAFADRGAEVVLTLSNACSLPGSARSLEERQRYLSGESRCALALAAPGSGESTTDFVFGGHRFLGEAGEVFSSQTGPGISVADFDLGRIRALRRGLDFGGEQQPIALFGDALRSDGSLYPLNPTPFLPRYDRNGYCLETFRIQAEGLARRLKAVGAQAVVGVSGGMDSTLALLVAVEAMELLGKPASAVHGITMPCFGTTGRTYRNSLALMEALGVTVREIDIREAVETHFRNLGHDPAVHNLVYENAQARERTQVLMDYAGMVGGLVVGTGDLSELALGWCTYNADQMSMYGVNASIPKTMVPLVISAAAATPRFAAARGVLRDILDTPISPELLPPDANGNITQHTEDLVGPYALHDFFLYHTMLYGYSKEKLLRLAIRAFREDYDRETVEKWFAVFSRRFHTQQFKRSCMPDGVTAGPISLSPRAGLFLPSDATF